MPSPSRSLLSVCLSACRCLSLSLSPSRFRHLCARSMVGGRGALNTACAPFRFHPPARPRRAAAAAASYCDATALVTFQFVTRAEDYYVDEKGVCRGLRPQQSCNVLACWQPPPTLITPAARNKQSVAGVAVGEGVVVFGRARANVAVAAACRLLHGEHHCGERAGGCWSGSRQTAVGTPCRCCVAMIRGQGRFLLDRLQRRRPLLGCYRVSQASLHSGVAQPQIPSPPPDPFPARRPRCAQGPMQRCLSPATVPSC